MDNKPDIELSIVHCDNGQRIIVLHNEETGRADLYAIFADIPPDGITEERVRTAADDFFGKTLPDTVNKQRLN